MTSRIFDWLNEIDSHITTLDSWLDNPQAERCAADTDDRINLGNKDVRDAEARGMDGEQRISQDK